MRLLRQRNALGPAAAGVGPTIERVEACAAVVAAGVEIPAVGRPDDRREVDLIRDALRSTPDKAATDRCPRQPRSLARRRSRLRTTRRRARTSPRSAFRRRELPGGRSSGNPARRAAPSRRAPMVTMRPCGLMSMSWSLSRYCVSLAMTVPLSARSTRKPPRP